jgi:hypothetical protein
VWWLLRGGGGGGDGARGGGSVSQRGEVMEDGDGLVVRRGRRGAIYSQSKAVRGEDIWAHRRRWCSGGAVVAGRNLGRQATGQLEQGDRTARAGGE